MAGSDRRRSPRHILGQTAEIHIGPATVLGKVGDVSAHGMGLILPGDTKVNLGDLIWVIVETVASYAITGTVRRIGEAGEVGVEFEEILTGDALAAIEELPINSDPDEYEALEEPKSS